MSTPGRKKELTKVEALVGVKHLQNSDTNPVVTASEIGEWGDVSNDTALDRLKELADDGLVHKKRIGARALVFWLTDAGLESLEDDC